MPSSRCSFGRHLSGSLCRAAVLVAGLHATLATGVNLHHRLVLDVGDVSTAVEADLRIRHRRCGGRSGRCGLADVGIVLAGHAQISYELRGCRERSFIHVFAPERSGDATQNNPQTATLPSVLLVQQMPMVQIERACCIWDVIYAEKTTTGCKVNVCQ